jgi:hypothetical protein
VKAKVLLNSSNPIIGPKVEISPRAFTLRVKAENRKNIFFPSAPKLLINAELYGLVLGPRLKKGSNEFEKPIYNPWGQCSSIH